MKETERKIKYHHEIKQEIYFYQKPLLVHYIMHLGNLLD